MKALRYARLYAHFVRFSLSKAMLFRFDFWFRIVMDVAYYLISLAFYKIIFLHTATLGGWSEEQALVFVGAFILIDALQMTIFSNNMWQLTEFINKGEVDYYLTRPVSPLFFLTLRDFSCNSLLTVFVALGILGWALTSASASFSLWEVSLFLFLILNGTLLHYFLRLLTAIPVFWTHSQRGLAMVFWATQRLGEKPDKIYRGTLRFLVLSLLPFGLMASIPSTMLFEGFSWNYLSLCLGSSLFLGLLVRILWKKGLEAYSSASS